MALKSKRVFACVFIAIVLFFTVQNAALIIEPLEAALQAEDGPDFVRFRDDVQAAFQSDKFFMKTAFVDLNGLASRLMGKHVINETIVLNNGMLAFDNEEPYPMEELAGHMTGVHHVLAQMGIEFLYVQMPHKVDADGALLPAGTQSSANRNADLLLECLDESGVRRLDLREGLSRSAQEIERYFFRTDHHWNFDGAFIGFNRIVQTLADMLGDSTDLSMYTDAANWEKRIRETPFLGSQGIRVGRYAAGLDRMEYYVPGFETDMSCMIHERRSGVHADFERALIRDAGTPRQGGAYMTDAYTVYIGSDYRLVSHRNEHAPVKKRILLIKDSFSLPVQSFMSTIYAEIDVMDKRYFRECSIVEYVLRTQPDAVILAASPTTFGEAFYYDYGDEAEERIRADMAQHVPVIGQQDVSITDSGCVLHEGFQADAVYTLSFEDVLPADGTLDFLTASLVEPQSGRHVYSWVFDLQYDRANGGFDWTFRTPAEHAEELQLMLYAGQGDEPSRESALVEGVKLWKGAL
ncbi:MAG: hypothetical protein E7321_05640 [Clostridiales bacterium]|nr:hypothetical protein [Clostridiales bacterium]